MLQTVHKITLLLFLAVPLAGCDQLADKIVKEYLKSELRDVCGEDDPECIASVDNQFDACQDRYEKEWGEYMNSVPSKEEGLMEVYSKKMYSCIVDDNGEPYFFYAAD